MQKNNIINGVLVGSLIVVAALSRLVDHPMNFTPVVAILIFCVAMIKNKVLRIILPLSVIIFSDILLQVTTGYGFHSGTSVVYLSFGAILILGILLLKKVSTVSVIGTSLLSSLVFFLITNFAFLYPVSIVPNPALGYYPHNFEGIIASYSAGLPFFRNMLVGDLFYSGLLFGSYSLISKMKFFSFANEK